MAAVGVTAAAAAGMFGALLFFGSDHGQRERSMEVGHRVQRPSSIPPSQGELQTKLISTNQPTRGDVSNLQDSISLQVNRPVQSVKEEEPGKPPGPVSFATQKPEERMKGDDKPVQTVNTKADLHDHGEPGDRGNTEVFDSVASSREPARDKDGQPSKTEPVDEHSEDWKPQHLPMPPATRPAPLLASDGVVVDAQKPVPDMQPDRDSQQETGLQPVSEIPVLPTDTADAEIEVRESALAALPDRNVDAPDKASDVSDAASEQADSENRNAPEILPTPLLFEHNDTQVYKWPRGASENEEPASKDAVNTRPVNDDSAGEDHSDSESAKSDSGLDSGSEDSMAQHLPVPSAAQPETAFLHASDGVFESDNSDSGDTLDSGSDKDRKPQQLPLPSATQPETASLHATDGVLQAQNPLHDSRKETGEPPVSKNQATHTENALQPVDESATRAALPAIADAHESENADSANPEVAPTLPLFDHDTQETYNWPKSITKRPSKKQALDKLKQIRQTQASAKSHDTVPDERAADMSSQHVPTDTEHADVSVDEAWAKAVRNMNSIRESFKQHAEIKGPLEVSGLKLDKENMLGALNNIKDHVNVYANSPREPPHESREGQALFEALASSQHKKTAPLKHHLDALKGDSAGSEDDIELPLPPPPLSPAQTPAQGPDAQTSDDGVEPGSDTEDLVDGLNEEERRLVVQQQAAIIGQLIRKQDTIFAESDGVLDQDALTDFEDKAVEAVENHLVSFLHGKRGNVEALSDSGTAGLEDAVLDTAHSDDYQVDKTSEFLSLTPQEIIERQRGGVDSNNRTAVAAWNWAQTQARRNRPQAVFDHAAAKIELERTRARNSLVQKLRVLQLRSRNNEALAGVNIPNDPVLGKTSRNIIRFTNDIPKHRRTKIQQCAREWAFTKYRAYKDHPGDKYHRNEYMWLRYEKPDCISCYASNKFQEPPDEVDEQTDYTSLDQSLLGLSPFAILKAVEAQSKDAELVLTIEQQCAYRWALRASNAPPGVRDTYTGPISRRALELVRSEPDNVFGKSADQICAHLGDARAEDLAPGLSSALAWAKRFCGKPAGWVTWTENEDKERTKLPPALCVLVGMAADKVRQSVSKEGYFKEPMRIALRNALVDWSVKNAPNKLTTLYASMLYQTHLLKPQSKRIKVKTFEPPRKSATGRIRGGAPLSCHAPQRATDHRLELWLDTCLLSGALVLATGIVPSL